MKVIRMFWRSWFGYNPVIGQKYEFDDFANENNPFDSKERYLVTVLDVKNGYVKYKGLYNHSSERSSTITSFRFSYKEITD